jgi:hypothetical protein
MKKLFEEYVESSDYKISVFFKELKSQIEKWFSDGSLKAQGCILDDIEPVNYNPMEKFLIVNFTEPILSGEDIENEENTFFKYRMTFMVRLDEMKGSEDNISMEGGEEENEQGAEINKILLKINQFNQDNYEKGELVEEVEVDDIKEDFIIDKIGQLKDGSDIEEVDDNDLKDNIYAQ